MAKRFKTSLLTVALASISFLLVTITFVRAHSTTAKEACIKTLRTIDAANRQWELEAKTIDTPNILPSGPTARLHTSPAQSAGSDASIYPSPEEAAHF